MHSLKRNFVSLVLLFWILPLTARTRVEGKKALTADGSKRVVAGAVVKAQRANFTSAFSAGMPEDSPSAKFMHFNSEKVAAALAPDSERSSGHGENAKNGVLLDWKGSENKYLVRVSRTGNPKGLAEAHSFSHVWYVQEGSASLITGGKLVNSRDVEPTPWGGKEVKGTGIEGGVPRHVSKGDVVIIPKGMPHIWTEIQGPFIYFVVNIR